MIQAYETIKTLEDKLGYLFIVRDKTILKKQIQSLTSLIYEITETKNEFITQQNEDEANKWLSIEDMSLAILDGLKLFLKLKQNDHDSAWIHLIDAQNHAYSSTVYELSGNIQKHCISHFHNIEYVLFPPQTFLSTSIVVSKSECSICHKEYSGCEHIGGESYMGKHCVEIYIDLERLDSVSIVDNPANKKCRITSYGVSPTINKMTLLDKSVDGQNN